MVMEYSSLQNWHLQEFTIKVLFLCINKQYGDHDLLAPLDFTHFTVFNMYYNPRIYCSPSLSAQPRILPTLLPFNIVYTTPLAAVSTDQHLSNLGLSSVSPCCWSLAEARIHLPMDPWPWSANWHHDLYVIISLSTVFKCTEFEGHRGWWKQHKR